MQEVNLLPWRQQNKIQHRKQKWLIAVLSVMTIVFLGLLIRNINLTPEKEFTPLIPEKSMSSSLHWVGYLQEGSKFLGFLQTTTGKMLSVEVGSFIGNARVIHIDESGVIFLQNQKKEWIGHAM